MTVEVRPEAAEMFDRLVTAIKAGTKAEVAAALRSGELTHRESAHAFTVAAQETARERITEEPSGEGER